MAECETCTGYDDLETIRIFRGIAQRIHEAVYGEQEAPRVAAGSSPVSELPVSSNPPFRGTLPL